MLLLLGCQDYDLKGAPQDPVGEDPEVAAPDIEVTPSSLSFAGVDDTCTATDTLTVANVGDAVLTVDGLSVASPFSVEAWAGTLEAGASVELTVSFAPGSAGGHVAEVIVTSDDPDEGELVVPVEGLAEAAGDVTDAYTQNGAGEVDVLWVIDNSGSMEEEQDGVADGIESFFSYFQTLGLDYHMGVITTEIVEPTQCGRLQGSPTYITSSTANAEDELAEAVAVGENDMGDESGLEAMELALSEPLLSGDNAGFYRDDAFLSVIFLSDEPDHSPEEPQYYIDFLEGLKADPYLVSVSAIVGDEDWGCWTICDWEDQSADPGNEYLELQEHFNGVFQSICTCDLGTTLDGIGWTSAGFRQTFPLSQTPSDTTAIVVSVDGTTTSDWSYVSSDNAVSFDDDAIPGAFAAIEISYPVENDCF